MDQWENADRFGYSEKFLSAHPFITFVLILSKGYCNQMIGLDQQFTKQQITRTEFEFQGFKVVKIKEIFQLNFVYNLTIWQSFMALNLQNNNFASELFKQRELIPLKASQDQIQMAKRSLIYKKKCNSNVHSILFCKSLNSTLSELATQNEKKILEEERTKYFQYIRKSYRQKIPEDFDNQNKLKKIFKAKIREKIQLQNNKTTQQIKKRPYSTINSTINNLTSKAQNPKQNLKREGITAKSKIKTQVEKVETIKEKSNLKSIDHDENDSAVRIQADANFESEVDLKNDELDDSYNQSEQK